MNVKIKLLNDKAVMPAYAKDGDAGMDLTATEITETENYISYKTGVSVAIPKGFCGLLFPRSSVTKTSLVLGNSVGLVDSGFRGEIEFRFKRVNNNDIVYNVGDRIGQIVIIPHPDIIFVQVDELPTEGDRGGGYGSTGK